MVFLQVSGIIDVTQEVGRLKKQIVKIEKLVPKQEKMALQREGLHRDPRRGPGEARRVQV